MTPVDFAAGATEYLASTHGYSLSLTLPPESEIKDPVARWMDAGLDGHCEFFASSLVLLSRAAGFQSRLVVGFKGGSWNAFENYYMVRNSDAHAWVEVREDDGTWRVVDATPFNGRQVEHAQAAAASGENTPPTHTAVWAIALAAFGVVEDQPADALVRVFPKGAYASAHSSAV